MDTFLIDQDTLATQPPRLVVERMISLVKEAHATLVKLVNSPSSHQQIDLHVSVTSN